METPTTPAERLGLPWENRERLGFFTAMIDTVKMVLLDPGPAFKQMRRDNALGGPILFAVVLGTIGGAAGLLWQLLMSMVAPALTGGASQLFETGIGFAVIGVLMPAFVIFYLFLMAAIVHVLLLMVDGGRFGFETTFKVIAFSYGSTAILNVVPIFGGFAAAIWVLVSSIFGLIEAQETTGGKASFAVLLPLALCCLCVCAVAVMAIGAGVMSGIK